MFFCVCLFLSRSVGDTEDAIDELENEVEKLKKNEQKRTGVEKWPETIPETRQYTLGWDQIGVERQQKTAKRRKH